MRIKEILRERGMTAKELASQIGMTETGLSLALGKGGNPSLKRLHEIAYALEVPIWQLFASSKEVEASKACSPFMAMVKDGSETYTAFSLPELERVVADIKGKGKRERNQTAESNTQTDEKD